MKKVLFISYNSFNQNLADVIQNNRVVELLKKRYEVDVLVRGKNKTDNENDIISIDLSIIDKILYKLCSFLYPVFSLNTRLWCRCAFKKIAPRLNNYDLVIVPFEPYSVLPLVNRIKKACSLIKIVTILYDPLANNLFFNRSNKAIKYRSIIERRVVSLSTKIIVNNKKELAYLQEVYPIEKEKFVLIPLIARKPNLTAFETSLTTLVHTGSIHGKRTIDELNNAITSLKKKHPNLSSCLMVVLYGRCLDGELNKVINAGNEDVILFKGYVPVTQIDQIYCAADAFVLIDPMEKGNYSFPSKLCDYAQYKKPILCIGSLDNPSAMLLKDYNIPSFTSGASEQIATYIDAIINHRLSVKTEYELLSDVFNINTIENAYYKLIDGLI